MQTTVLVNISQEITVDENQKYDSYTDIKTSDMRISELKEAGYREIRIEFTYELQKIKQDGDCAKIWLEIDGKNVIVRDRFELTSSREKYNSSVVLDIDELSDNAQIRVGLFAYGDYHIGKYTFTFYQADILFIASL